MLWTHREHLGTSVTSHVYRCTFIQLQAEAGVHQQTSTSICVSHIVTHGHKHSLHSDMVINILFPYALCTITSPQVHPRNQSLYVHTGYVCVSLPSPQVFASMCRATATYVNACCLYPQPAPPPRVITQVNTPHKYPWLSV